MFTFLGRQGIYNIRFRRRERQDEDDGCYIAIPDDGVGNVTGDENAKMKTMAVIIAVIDDGVSNVTTQESRTSCDDDNGTEIGEESDLQNEISLVATDNGSLEQGSEDGLMQDDTELTKVGGSSADEHVIDSNDKAGAIELVDESLKGAW
ncbi:hypothetical protein Tco_1402701 [Tanacetum coccineum]